MILQHRYKTFFFAPAQLLAHFKKHSTAVGHEYGIKHIYRVGMIRQISIMIYNFHIAAPQLIDQAVVLILSGLQIRRGRVIPQIRISYRKTGIGPANYHSF